MILELQQRSVEFSALFSKVELIWISLVNELFQHDNLRPGVLEKMPLFEKSEIEATYSQEEIPAEAAPISSGPTSAMDDLLGLGDIGGGAPAAAPVSATPAPQSALDDLLGGLGAPAPPVVESG